MYETVLIDKDNKVVKFGPCYRECEDAQRYVAANNNRIASGRWAIVGVDAIFQEEGGG